MSRILVTGASGFVGTCLVDHLRARGRDVIAASRRRPGATAEGTVCWTHCDLAQDPPLPPAALAGVGAIIHLAGLAHRSSADAEPHLRRINADGAVAVAREAARAGVRRFVFVSSATVYGDRSDGTAFDEASPPEPRDAYARSKLAAEWALGELAAGGAMELVVVRAPLVYGPGAKGNFRRLLEWALAGRPLPKATLRNRRSVIGLGNLCTFLELCARHEAAAGETFVVSDGEDVSTGELYARLCRAAGRRPRFVPVPARGLALALRAVGRGDMVPGLLADLRLDAAKAQRLLDWRPRHSMGDELKRAVRRCGAGTRARGLGRRRPGRAQVGREGHVRHRRVP